MGLSRDAPASACPRQAETPRVSAARLSAQRSRATCNGSVVTDHSSVTAPRRLGAARRAAAHPWACADGRGGARARIQSSREPARLLCVGLVDSGDPQPMEYITYSIGLVGKGEDSGRRVGGSRAACGRLHQPGRPEARDRVEGDVAGGVCRSTCATPRRLCATTRQTTPRTCSRSCSSTHTPHPVPAPPRSPPGGPATAAPHLVCRACSSSGSGPPAGPGKPRQPAWCAPHTPQPPPPASWPPRPYSLPWPAPARYPSPLRPRPAWRGCCGRDVDAEPYKKQSRRAGRGARLGRRE